MNPSTWSVTLDSKRPGWRWVEFEHPLAPGMPMPLRVYTGVEAARRLYRKALAFTAGANGQSRTVYAERIAGIEQSDFAVPEELRFEQMSVNNKTVAWSVVYIDDPRAVGQKEGDAASKELFRFLARCADRFEQARIREEVSE